MDLVRIAQLLGNIGEFIGALGVVATLFYLAVQVRHSKAAMDANTRALEEDRKVRLAEAYQSRLTNMSANARLLAESESLADIHVRVRRAGYPDPRSLDALNPVDRRRWESWTHLQYLNIENLHLQYELGLLDSRFYEEIVRNRIRELGDVWTELGLTKTMGRPAFHEEVERVLNRF